jgi:hypothetical protein
LNKLILNHIKWKQIENSVSFYEIQLLFFIENKVFIDLNWQITSHDGVPKIKKDKFANKPTPCKLIVQHNKISTKVKKTRVPECL